ncbi:2-amino-4-hydroxy-6-hydroxymethyldihydropteridine diphosphokinase [Glaciihabitans arcticus]|uniref:2-amino-4-hydroxy-6-hydroxymethyldihydropteridine diphosphokinase n=1 Tax=Glaciihabitans arcticus TaxID=2668039 RepID=A0A4V2JF38_9MICO|nr:2-amino-4-hydroxy-6-hydroxymethyldihydropteridine diphosphokinase [Glaciihabitans arcticus]TBN57969.1 2-amino-4-hydroxy-6-hydroxymethyldihydropteridine diphosphokinase [Glaciihabitans arcticus]
MIRAERLTVELPVVLSLGSNLGDREETIRDAVAAISALSGVRAVAASGLVETPALKPDGVDEDAPAYLNAILTIRTRLAPEQLLDATSAIELEHGRTRSERWGDRTLDIDIVSWGGLTLESDRLTLPHPRAAQRAFVLAPWLEVAPQAKLAGEGVADLLAATGDTVRPYPAEPLL